MSELIEAVVRCDVIERVAGERSITADGETSFVPAILQQAKMRVLAGKEENGGTLLDGMMDLNMAGVPLFKEGQHYQVVFTPCPAPGAEPVSEPEAAEVMPLIDPDPEEN